MAEDFRAPDLPEAAYDLAVIEIMMNCEVCRPEGLEWRPLDGQTYAARLPGMEEAIRLTTSAMVFDESGERHQLYSPGRVLFEPTAKREASDEAEEKQPAVCWMLRDSEGKVADFVVNTRDGFARAERLDVLLELLDRAGKPFSFPELDWPGFRAVVLA